MTVAATFNREGGLMAARGGVELPVAYATLALTLAATGPGKYRLGPSLPEGLVAVGALVGGAAAGAIIARMVMNKQATAEVAAEAPAPDA